MSMETIPFKAPGALTQHLQCWQGRRKEWLKQAGAELGQAQAKLELG